MDCYFDRDHGVYKRWVTCAPRGGTPRSYAVCAKCADALDAGRMPPVRERPDAPPPPGELSPGAQRFLAALVDAIFPG